MAALQHTGSVQKLTESKVARVPALAKRWESVKKGMLRMQQRQQMGVESAHWLEPLQAPSAHRRSRP